MKILTNEEYVAKIRKMHGSEEVGIAVQRLSTSAKLPIYTHSTDAGMDICADEDVTIAPCDTGIVHTGLAVAVPEGYELQIRPRSGISLNTPLRIPNTPGTIDAGYRGELCVLIHNDSDRYYTDGIGKVKIMPDIAENHHTISTKGYKKGWYDIKKGDRIAQAVLMRVPKAEIIEVEDVRQIETNRNGGFGSTGVQ